MTEELEKTRCTGTWWEVTEDEVPGTEEIEIAVSFEDDSFYIDGLRDGYYLSIPLHAIAKAIADTTKPAKGLVR